MEVTKTCSECGSRLGVFGDVEVFCDCIDGLRAWRAELLSRIDAQSEESEKYKEWVETIEGSLTWREAQHADVAS